MFSPKNYVKTTEPIHVHLKTTESTQVFLMQPQNHSHIDLVTTDTQTKGIGTKRNNSSWEGGSGNLLCSIKCHTFDMLSLIVGAVVHEILTDKYSVPSDIVSLKWPNDILINGRKCGGIITDVEGDVAIVGIGVNLITSPVETSSERYDACNVFDECGIKIDPQDFAKTIYSVLNGYIKYCLEFGLNFILNYYNKHISGFIYSYKGEKCVLCKVLQGGDLLMKSVETDKEFTLDKGVAFDAT